MHKQIKSKKKVCFLLQSHYSHTMGGAEYRCNLFLNYLIETNQYDLYYLCNNVDSNFVPKGYKIIQFGSKLRKYGSYFDLFELYQVLKKLNPDIIYQNGGSSHTGIAAFYSKKNNSKLIHQICNDNTIKKIKYFNSKSSIRFLLNDIAFRYGIKRADIVVGQSSQQNELLITNYKRACDIIVPLGHPVPKISKKNEEKIKILWVSNFKFHQKQPELFIELAKQFKNYNNVTFVMIGKSIGEKEKFKSLLMEIKKTKNLVYLGGTTQDQVNNHLASGNLLINTSRYEGFPNVYVQAWMREVPIVTLYIDPNCILKNEKIGFHSGNMINMIEDVKKLIENRKLLVKMGKKAREYAIKEHSIDVMSKQLSSVF